MRTVAFHTLGCKVNQYDSQAMLELFEQAGYELRHFDEPADVYVINTCTVTGTGDKKSLQAVRRALRQNPAAKSLSRAAWPSGTEKSCWKRGRGW